jgi:hypothetical protein
MPVQGLPGHIMMREFPVFQVAKEVQSLYRSKILADVSIVLVEKGFLLCFR